MADRSPVMLRGLMELLTDDGFAVVGSTSTAEVSELVAKSPDALLIDLQLLLDDPQLWPDVQHTPVILGVVRRSVADAMPYVQSGVAGIWDRDSSQSELTQIVAGAISGELQVSAAVGGEVMSRLSADQTMTGLLTAREREILSLMAEGASNRGIAERLVISENTVRNHVRSVLEKLQASSRTEAVVIAARAGLIQLR
ncbi:MAG: response regulator transcription factor [Actinomycetia bacterium]|nr:response regulator transcription factor [Actinomycetes bacterium]MCH9800746.1 response regulator transcription factor [Actinomycetes bacterium]